MAGSNGVLEVPSGTATFSLPGGQSFEVDLLGAVEAWRALARERPQHGDYLQAVIGWVKERSGVALNLSQADWLSDKVGELYAEKKREQVSAFSAAWNSLNSTASAPSA